MPQGSTIREKIDNNIVLFFLITIATSFVSGIGFYVKALDYFGYRFISYEGIERPKHEIEQLKEEKKNFKDELLILGKQNDALKNMIFDLRIELSKSGKITKEEINVPIAALEKKVIEEVKELKIHQKKTEEIRKKIIEEDKKKKEIAKRIGKMLGWPMFLGIAIAMCGIIALVSGEFFSCVILVAIGAAVSIVGSAIASFF